MPLHHRRFQPLSGSHPPRFPEASALRGTVAGTYTPPVMTKDRIRLGIVGANVDYGWGSKAHLPAILTLPEYELTAVCTAHADTAAASARRFGARFAYHDYRAMLANPEIDVVTICVRASQHQEITRAALEAGKHVFTEWPLGGTLAIAEEMAALARKRRAVTMVGLQGRGSPPLLYFKELLGQAYIGRVLAASLAVYVERPTSYVTAQDVADDPSKGHRVLWIQAGHNIDAFCFVLGEFRGLAAFVTTRVPERHRITSRPDVPGPAPDRISVTGTLENGAAASILVTTNTTVCGGWRLDVAGTEGALSAYCPYHFQYGQITITELRQGGTAYQELPIPPRLVTAPEGTPAEPPFNVAQLYGRLADGIRTSAGVQPSFEDAVRRHELLAAIQRSADEGTRQGPS